MKKIFVAFTAMLLSCSFLFAQKTRFGFTAGASISNYTIKVDNASASGSAIAGITAGVLAEIPLSADFSFQPALNLTHIGTKEESNEGNIAEKFMIHSYNAELLMNCLFNTKTKTGTFFIGAGPSVSMGIFGKWKDVSVGETNKGNLKFGNSDDDDIRPFDVGANILTGFRFSKGFLVAVNYNQGLNNLMPGGSDNGKVSSHYFGIRVGFLLNNKK